MSIRCKGTAKLKILETGEVFEIKPDDLEWEVFDTDERQLGLEISHCGTFYFYSEQGEFDGKVEWDVYEYPIGTVECYNVDFEPSCCELLEDFYDIYSDSLDEEIEVTFPENTSPEAIAKGYRELEQKIFDEYNVELTYGGHVRSSDGLKTIKVRYSPEIENGDLTIKEPLEKRVRELEQQNAHLRGMIESKDLEMERLERLLSMPNCQINNSVNLQIGDNNSMSNNRTINMGDGNYYENINTSGGNYIQGNYINMNSDLAQAASQIQDLMEQLQKKGITVDAAQTQVAQDVAAQAQKDPVLRDKLVKWGQSLGDATISDVVKGVVKLAIRSAGLPLP